MPLIVSHGWPGSIVEQLEIIEPLTDPPANEAERGGHFAAWEQPQLFAEELRAAFRALR